MLEFEQLTEGEEKEFYKVKLAILNKIIDKYIVTDVNKMINGEGDVEFLRGGIKKLRDLKHNLDVIQKQIHNKLVVQKSN